MVAKYVYRRENARAPPMGRAAERGLTMEKHPNNRREAPRGTDIIAGRNAVTEALKAGRAIDSLYVQRGERSGGLQALIAKAKEAGATIKEADPKKLEHLCGGANHQGVVAVAAVKEYATVEDLFQRAQERGEPPFFVICDELEDPHNLGAVIRTAECAGAHGVIVPKRRSVGLTYAVGKASAGAVEHLPVARVGNLSALLDQLKDRGLWIYAADMDGAPGARRISPVPQPWSSAPRAEAWAVLSRKKQTLWYPFL